MIKQLLVPLFGGNQGNIYARPVGCSRTSCLSHRWISSLESRCADFLSLMMMGPNYARAVAMSFLVYDPNLVS